MLYFDWIIDFLGAVVAHSNQNEKKNYFLFKLRYNYVLNDILCSKNAEMLNTVKYF